MASYEIKAEMNLQNFIKESREVAQALNEFADNLERIEKKYDENKYDEENYDEENYDEENYEIVNLGNGLYERRRKLESEE